MLYDNALLSMAYLEGYQASGDEDLKRVAKAAGLPIKEVHRQALELYHRSLD